MGFTGEAVVSEGLVPASAGASCDPTGADSFVETAEDAHRRAAASVSGRDGAVRHGSR